MSRNNVTVQVKDNILNASFKACYEIVSTLINKKQDSTLNITNWQTELFSNEVYDAKTHNLTLKLTIDGVNVGKKYTDVIMPATSKGDGQAKAYVGNMHNCTFDDKVNETCLLFAYLTAWLFSGKQLAIVNQGRALILNEMIKSLNISFAELTINHLSFGGNPEKTARDYIISFDDMKNLITFQLTRASKLLALGDKTGHETRTSVARKQDKTETFTF